MILRFPLRPGRLVAIKCPSDLTVEDVARITAVLSLVVIPARGQDT